MAGFFVGQRVRVKWFRYPKGEPPAEGRVSKLGPWAPMEYHPGFRLPADCIVLLDDGEEVAPTFDQLEPILPDGHRAGDYSLSDLLDRCRAGEGVPA